MMEILLFDDPFMHSYDVEVLWYNNVNRLFPVGRWLPIKLVSDIDFRVFRKVRDNLVLHVRHEYIRSKPFGFRVYLINSSKVVRGYAEGDTLCGDYVSGYYIARFRTMMTKAGMPTLNVELIPVKDIAPKYTVSVCAIYTGRHILTSSLARVGEILLNNNVVGKARVMWVTYANSRQYIRDMLMVSHVDGDSQYCGVCSDVEEMVWEICRELKKKWGSGFWC